MPKQKQLSCRPEQFSGEWSCYEPAFTAYESAVMQILNSPGQLEKVTQESILPATDEKGNPVPEDKGYTVDADGIAHLDIDGVLTKYPTSFRSRLGGTSYHDIQSICRNMMNDASIRGVLLNVDSPGGLSNGVDEASDFLAKVAKKVPMEAHVHGISASAGYRLTAEAGHITADPAAMVGSIGTRTFMRDNSDAYKAAGITLHHAASGEQKLDGVPGRPVSEGAIQRMKDHVNENGSRFADNIVKLRKLNENQSSEIRKGGVYWAAKAKEHGLIDAVGFTADAVEHLKNTIATRMKDRTGKANPFPNPAVKTPERSRTMLTADQLVKAQSLPGCANITAETADSVLLAAALSLNTTAQDRFTVLNTANEEIKKLKDIAAPVDPRTLMMAANESNMLLSALSGPVLTPACCKQLQQTLIGPVDQAGAFVSTTLNTALLTPDATGVTQARKVISALATNKPVLKDATGKQLAQAQVVDRVTPGTEGTEGTDWKADAAKQGKALGDKYNGVPVKTA